MKKKFDRCPGKMVQNLKCSKLIFKYSNDPFKNTSNNRVAIVLYAWCKFHRVYPKIHFCGENGPPGAEVAPAPTLTVNFILGAKMAITVTLLQHVKIY